MVQRGKGFYENLKSGGAKRPIESASIPGSMPDKGTFPDISVIQSAIPGDKGNNRY